MLLVIHAPREMVDRPDTPRAASAFGRLPHIQDAGRTAEPVPNKTVLFPEPFKAQDVGDETLRRLGVALPHLRAIETTDLSLFRNAAAVPRREVARRHLSWLDERHLQPVRIDQRQHTVAEATLDGANRYAVLLEPRSPEIETAGGNLQRHLHGESVPDPRRRHLRPWEERQIRSGMSLCVRVEQVIRTGVV